MKKNVCLAIVSGLLAGSIASSASAFSFKGFKPLKVVEAVAVAPAKAIAATAKFAVDGGSASAILDPAKDVAASLSAVPKIAASATTWPNEQIYQAAKSVASAGGKPGEFIFDVATFVDQYQQQLIKTTGEVAANTLIGENPLQFVAVPLAAAIREGREQHIANAKPLPDDVKQGLATFFPSDILARAKYTIGTAEITLPNGIGKTQKLFGSDFAVTVDDVIVFSEDPGTFLESPGWWAHEVFHTQQFAQWGVEQFAFKYVKSVSSVEQPAKSQGAIVQAWAQKNWPGASKSNVIASHMVNSPADMQQEPLLPAAHVKFKEAQTAQTVADPIIIQCVFPGDPNQYFGTQNGRLIVKDPATGEWMHIGWAVPPDIAGPSWVYLIPGRVVYDAFSDGALVARYTYPMGPYGPPGPPAQVGHFFLLPPS